jgi:uncharacterized membrane protein YjjP (DUF1212 family)
MVELIPTGLAAFAVVLFGLALLAMTEGNFGVAGVTFLGASVVIYFRETRLGDASRSGGP